MKTSGLSIHHILCPTDFSVHAKSAYAEAVRVARWFSAKVTLLHVVTPEIPVGGELLYVPPLPTSSRALRKAKLQEMDAGKDALNHAGVEVDTVLREGDVVHEIRRFARESAVDLVVMGTQGRTGLGRVLLGSVTEAILRHAPAPVLTVNRPVPHDEKLYRSVLCAVDVSEWSAGTVEYAIGVSGDGADHLTVLSVIEDLPELRARAQGMFTVEEIKRFRDGLERDTIAEIQERIPDEARSGCRIEEHVRFGQAHREILTVAEAESADLIVMGSHGRGAIERLVFGSTVRKVIRAARCPVLVVPAGYAWPATEIATLGGSERPLPVLS
ncbi:MAG TPA: universal stress protein, partial [Candidatus Polarisedimenticolaceae bacterium]|nr:universal stress protein [Candidatus Polarisedimenticolaceae bacterium]